VSNFLQLCNKNEWWSPLCSVMPMQADVIAHGSHSAKDCCRDWKMNNVQKMSKVHLRWCRQMVVGGQKKSAHSV
jgi:hypothetical protein